ncbi:MAG TPA: hypothetical protein PLI09_22015 [Candidatus Hydrogenedentes bacterium]|nr:hypothetical protein [Candidatus Hydrogenedentota bacterium]
MKRNSLFILILLLAVFIALGTLQNRHLQQLRASEAFYRWILAAATNERLFSDQSEGYDDKSLFMSIADATESLLPEVSTMENTGADPIRPVSRLGMVAGEQEHRKTLWKLVSGPVLAQQRQRFLDDARQRKLLFAKDIQYAEAQASGVNVFNLFFGFRKVAATFVWIQVDRFWHQGMMYRMIPLMKTCVTLDPNFVDAYLLGAWHLAYNATAKMVDTPQALKTWSDKYQTCLGEKERYYYLAVDFLQDGIQKNSDNYKLYFDLGFAVYKNKLQDYEKAVKYLTPATYKMYHDRWVPRQLFICLELNGQYEKALEGWQQYVKEYPESQSALETAPRFIKRNQAFIQEKEAEKAEAEAKATADPVAAQLKRKEAEEHTQAALRLWTELNEPFGDYRIARLHALDLGNEGRYIEAIGVLEKARWDNLSSFDEASELIMEFKQKGNIPLSVSEKKAMLRKEEGETCTGQPAASK